MSTNQIPEIHPELITGIEDVFFKNQDILLVNLCTLDGQNIRSFVVDDLTIENEAIADMASHLFKLSQSSSKKMFSKKLDVITIENNKGHMLFVKTRYLNLKCVLTVASKSSTPLANIRFIAKRLAKTIKAIPS